MKNSKFYTVPEAAKKFGVDRRTMSRWVADRKIQSIATPGGHHRIKRMEIESLLKQNGFKKQVTNKGSQDQKRILIVDDDDTFRKVLAQRLMREKFNVKTASNGFQAGLRAKDFDPDLILLDIIMEGIDGFEVCQEIKADKTLVKSKIIIMSGFDTPGNREKSLQAGADLFLSKGKPFDEVLYNINKLLGFTGGNDESETE